MPIVNNIYVYRDSAHGVPILVLHGNCVRTLAGSYVGVQGQIQAGQQIEKDQQYRLCEGAAYNTINNTGQLKTCTRIGVVDGSNPPRPESDFE